MGSMSIYGIKDYNAAKNKSLLIPKDSIVPRPIHALISPSAMSHNVEQVRARIQRTQQHLANSNHAVQQTQQFICAVIKANAYGHGTLNAIKGFAKADALGMIDVEDLVRCREAGWHKPLLLLEGFFDAKDIPVLQEQRVTTAIHSDEQIAMLAQAKAAMPIDVFLKINTGMNRLGFLPAQAAQKLAELEALQHAGKVGRIGHMMHFANADLDTLYVQEAYQQILQARGAYPGALSICNSAASLRYPQFAFAAQENWLRPGICLYGSTPFNTELADDLAVNLKPTMTLQAKVLAVQTLKTGDSVGYGSAYTAERETRIGVVACGYADGYPRSAKNGTPVSVDGQQSQLLGRVSMDMLTVDLSHLPQAGVGSTVVLWGEGGPSIDTVADFSGRIGYELMCGLTKRVPQHIID